MGRKVYDEEDDPNYGYKKDRDRKKIKWTAGKVIFTIILYIISIILIIDAILPILEGDFEPKNIANQFFSLMHIFYMISFTAVKKNKNYVFWSASFVLLDIMTIFFIFYEELFF